jgi:protein-arginine kinase
MKAQALVRLPYLSKEPQFLGDICSQRYLSFEPVYATTPSGKAIKSEAKFLVQNIRTFGLTELDIVMDLYSGVKEIVDIENRFKPVEPVAEKPQNATKTLTAVPKIVKT